MRSFILFIGICCVVMVFSASLMAQDTIVKLNGQVIPAKVIEVGTNAIRYSKSDIKEGPIFVDYKTDIAYVKYSNGQKDVFNNQPQVATIQKPLLDTAAGKNLFDQLAPGQKTRIEFMNNRYTVNGQRVKRKDVDRLLSKSKNPAVQIGHKTAKTTRILQKVVGLTSIGSTPTGGIMTISTIFTCWKEARNGGSVSTGSYVNAGLSFLGTLTLPITSKILKNRRDKLYDKTIDLYNETN